MDFSECDYFGTLNNGPTQIIQADKRIFYKDHFVMSEKALKIFQDEILPYFVFLILQESNSFKCFLILFTLEDLSSLAKINTLNSSNCEIILIIPHATSEFQSNMDCHLKKSTYLDELI